MIAVLPAFLVEEAFFLVLGIEEVRTRVEKRLPGARMAWALVAAAAAPYLECAIALGRFRWTSLGLLVLLAAVASFWFVRLPRSAAVDVLFLIVLALVVLAKLFGHIYPAPHPKVPLEILGQLMWVRTGAFALLSLRKVQGVGFGFVPRWKDWGIGCVFYLLFLPVGGALAAWLGFARPHLPALAWWKVSLVTAGTFAGFLWVVALSEEFVFRGLLQQWIGKWLHSDAAGLVGASLLFGSVHLPFRAFPNWRFALLAFVAALFFGMAFRKAASIRASMVTHALVATTWRIFFS